MSTFLGGYREVLVDPSKEVFEEVYYGVVTQEVICVASNYQDIFGESLPKVIKSIVYDILEKS